MSRNAPLVPGLIAMCPSACLAVRACDDYDLRTLLHGPRHDTGNAVPESNLKSRVGCRRAVARRADNQARAMAAIAVGEREEWAAPRRVKPVSRERTPAFSAALIGRTADLSCRRR